MKRYVAIFLCMILCVGILSGCSSSELEEKESLVLDLQNELAEKETLISNLQGELTTTMENLGQAKSAESDYAQKYENTLAEKQKVSDELANVSSKLQNATTEYNTLKAEYDTYKAKMEPYEDLNAAEAEARRIEAERVAAEDKAQKEREAEEAQKKKEAEEAARKQAEEEKKRNAEGVPELPSNEFYTSLDTYTYSANKYRYFVYVIEGLSQKNVELKLVVSDKDGNVLDTSEDTVSLSTGGQTYFKLHIDEEYFNSSNTYNLKIKSYDPFLTREDYAVEYVKHNVSGNTLYVTVRQTKSDLSSFSQFKILLFNGTKLIDTKEGYFSVHADDLDGVDSVAVMSLPLYGKAKDFTSLSFYFEK